MKPILFNTEMVRAILDGRKTATRRVVKPQPHATCYVKNPRGNTWTWGFWEDSGAGHLMKPPYRPGDILYVRETWSPVFVLPRRYLYRADAEIGVGEGANLPIKWRPSIHMPKEAARLFLRVTDVRVERLQRIDDIQALEEGAEGDPCDCDGSEVFCSRCCNTGWFISPRSEFAGIWDSTIKTADRALYGWEANPLVWVIEFERITKEEAERT